MNYLVDLSSISEKSSRTIGGKAEMLARLHQEGFPIPQAYCLPVCVYRDFLEKTGLETFISMELQRKDFASMRWEEIWDVSLRIRNHFVTRDWPQKMKQSLLDDLRDVTTNWVASAVRSTAPGEDSGQQSFAGLHESRVMLRDPEAILEAVRTVWASLWSDRALLYRHELGLDPAKSGMAVIIQEMVVGEISGVLFSKAPHNRTVMMVEAVWGLNQALVDGTIEPDRWQFDRTNGTVIEKHEVKHKAAMRPAPTGVELCPLDEAEQNQSPLNETRCSRLHQVACQLENFLGEAIDLEWTLANEKLCVLQARPITATLSSQADDERPWYLSLHRSLENLEELQSDLEQNVLPGMEDDAKEMVQVDLTSLENHELAEEHKRRSKRLNYWLDVYKEKCIPMAHGLRLFGEFYNDLVKPEDPFEFVSLLYSDDLLAVQRNRELTRMAGLLRNNPAVLDLFKKNRTLPEDSSLKELFDDFSERFSGMNWVLQGDLDLAGWLINLAEQEGLPQELLPASSQEVFLESLGDEVRDIASRILKVAKASYLLRDNDNLYLGKVRAGLVASEQEISKRIAQGNSEGLDDSLLTEEDSGNLFARYKNVQDEAGSQPAKKVPRQLVGQPAGPGISTGLARVLDATSTLTDFKKGEVIVCDAIEPNMTFLAPLAAAIIERRGGMLIHGAIIAREYAIPCVTGIPEATRVIQTGDKLSVDGYLGIVTIDRSEVDAIP